MSHHHELATYANSDKHSQHRLALSSEDKFHFIAVLDAENPVNAENKRLARAHAAKHSFQLKRQSLHRHQQNFLSFSSVFCTDFDDPALFNALLLALQFAVNNEKFDTECLKQKSQTITLINKKLNNTPEALTNSTIGAILLLLGVELRLGSQSQVQIHLNGISQLLKLCREYGVNLSDGIKRSIFCQWQVPAWSGPTPAIPKAFKPILNSLGNEFPDILREICTLQNMRDSLGLSRSINVLSIDSRQALIEYRLYDCRTRITRSDYLLGCCIDAAYLCTYMMFSEIWGGDHIPSHFASELLLKLQQTENSGVFAGHEELLSWMIVIGGAFTAYNLKRAYAVLLNFQEQKQQLLLNIKQYNSSNTMAYHIVLRAIKMTSSKRVEFFTVDGVTLRGDLYMPKTGAKDIPIVVMTQGEHYLPDFASRFQAAGYAVLIYDHRGWGSSEGQPRNAVNPMQQAEDYHDAIIFARTIPGIDKDRVAMWGIGHSGGASMISAGNDDYVKAVILVMPLTSGARDAAGFPPELIKRSVEERLERTQNPNLGETYVQVWDNSLEQASGDRGQVILHSPPAYEFISGGVKRSDAAGTPWENKIALRSLYDIGRVEPQDYIRRISPRPLLYLAAVEDVLTGPLEAHKKVFDQAGEPKRFVTLNNHHVANYFGSSFEKNITAQLQFLEGYL
ncbi:Alpha/Beta hydrolase protein [Trichoderma evansii]